MYPDTAAGFVSGSLCLLEVKWGGWGGIRALIRGRNKPRSQSVLYNEVLTSSLLWFSVGSTQGVWQRGLTLFIPQHGVVGSQPCWFVYSLSVGPGNHQCREFVSRCPPWREINIGCPHLIFLGNKRVMHWRLPFFHPTSPQIFYLWAGKALDTLASPFISKGIKTNGNIFLSQ